jgi:hypothetical protein
MTHLAAYIFHQKRKRKNLENSGISESEKQRIRDLYYAKAKEQTKGSS